MKAKKIGIILLVIGFLLSGYLLSNNLKKEVDIEEDKDNTLYRGKFGSAGKITGTSLVVSIYADDAISSWSTASTNDINNTLDKLKIATNWLEEQVKRYGKEAKFIYDWKEYADLKYNVKFEDNNFKENTDGYYFYQREWIENNIDVKKLADKYQFDNIIFIFLFNMKDSADFVRSNASGISEGVYDIINLFIQDDVYTHAASYAHEILHLYGAPDLYRVNELINQDYVDYVNEYRYDDIMNFVNASKDITNIFSDIDAYYVGLINECDDVDKWHLVVSKYN